MTTNAAPNAVSIIANGVTIKGFTIRSEYLGDRCKSVPFPTDPTCYPGSSVSDEWPNTAAVMVGGTSAGMDPAHEGVTGATVKDCDLYGHTGLYNWRSSNTLIQGNTIGILQSLYPNTKNGNGITVYDGWYSGVLPRLAQHRRQREYGF